MKNIIFISTFVLSQTLLATTLTIYSSGIALIQESHNFGVFKNDTEFVYKNIPNSILFDSLSTELPKDISLKSLTYKKATTTHRPLLSFNIDTKKSIQGELELQYLAYNINFTTDYALDITNNRASLSGWVNIENNSGKDFKDTSINLVAGEINHLHNTPSIAYKAMAQDIKSSSMPQQQAIQNYHLYKIPSKLSLNSGEEKRIKLLHIDNITLQNNYIAKMYNPLYLMGERTSKVYREVILEKLQKILPAGKVRIYTQYEESSLLLGETTIPNTPKNTPLTLKVGQDFDTKVLQKIISRQDTRDSFNATIEYSVINHSQEDRIIQVAIPFNKNLNSKIKSDLKYRYTKGNFATFTLKVKASSQKSFEVNFKSKRH